MKILIIVVISLVVYIYMNKSNRLIESVGKNEIEKTTTGKSHSLEEKDLIADQQEIVSQLNKTDIKVADRIELITKLDLKNQNIDEITDFISSKNPYANEVQGADPHSIVRTNYDKEAALRVYAIKRLSESLSNEDFRKVVLNIESDAQDDSLKRISKLALESKLKGESYFENLKKAIENQELPSH